MLLRKQPLKRCVAAALMLLTAVSAQAQDLVVSPASKGQALEFDQIIYRGVVGNLLETVPLDPDKRVELQRGNAVISNAFSGRTLAVLLGVASPVLMIGGLAWGLFAASRIKPSKLTTTALTAVPAAAPIAALAAAAGVCGEAWLAMAEAAAPGLAPETPPVPPRDEVAVAQP